MSNNDRFDRPLARAARPHGGDVTAACLNAETLAAWTDGSLRPAERAAAEAHAADCGRCLELLATMAKTEPPPSVTSRAPWFSVRWLVPLTTAAAVVVTALVLVRDPGIVPAPEVQKTAPAPASPVPTPVVPSAAETKEDAFEARRDRDQRKDVREKKEAGNTPAPLADNAASKPATDALARQRAESPGAAATQAPQAKAAQAPAAQAAQPPPPSAAAPQTFKAEAARENVDQLQARRAMTAGVIASPDPAVQWRFSGRSIERTVNGGRTWTTQATATAELLAGAAPAPGICWIVGRSGLVMLTRAGQTW
ncbi:MAG TPA: hypothetical protein VE379_02070, partial [Vicinamibacterales bacterium]|nr:hypothetical protein [Vicinamibacterales bacterium]